MMTLLKRLFGATVEPITHNDVPPAPRDPVRETEIKAAQAQQVCAIMAVERRSWEIRQALAGHVLSIVSGDDR